MAEKVIIAWSQIEAECDGYRGGFVATYRKYQGQPTDETDGQGRLVKVTVTSFARHNGIPERTFRDWVTKAADDAPAARETPRRVATKAAAFLKTAEEEEELIRTIAKRNPNAVRKVFSEQQPQHTEAERKAAQAAASAVTGPIKEAAAQLHATEADGIADLLNEAADDLAAIEGRIGKRTLNALTKAYGRVGEEIQVLAYRSELSEEVG